MVLGKSLLTFVQLISLPSSNPAKTIPLASSFGKSGIDGGQRQSAPDSWSIVRLIWSGNSPLGELGFNEGLDFDSLFVGPLCKGDPHIVGRQGNANDMNACSPELADETVLLRYAG